MMFLKEDNNLKFCLFSMRRGFGSGQNLFILQGWLLNVNVESSNSEMDDSGIELETFITNVTVPLIERLKHHIIAKVHKKIKKATVK